MRPPLTRFCKRQHDTFLPNARTPRGDCRACRNIKSALYRKSRKTTWPKADPREPRVPFEPLRDALLAAGMLPRIDATTRRRWTENGVTIGVADYICCALLSKHPCELWGALWFAA